VSPPAEQSPFRSAFCSYPAPETTLPNLILIPEATQILPAQSLGTRPRQRFRNRCVSQDALLLSAAKAYNRIVKLHGLSLPLAFLVLAGCGRTSQTKEAVQQGIRDYLATRPDLDLGAIEVEVTAVSFRQDDADATVAFRPKGGGPGSGMEMRYTLEQKGGRWAVKGKGHAPPGVSPHGAPPPAEAAKPPASRMPPDHPPVGRAKPAEKAK